MEKGLKKYHGHDQSGPDSAGTPALNSATGIRAI
jgi:hypothetical protein